jgi:hypothetical protein
MVVVVNVQLLATGGLDKLRLYLQLFVQRCSRNLLGR